MVENSAACGSDESGNRTAREAERERGEKERSFRVVHARLPLGHRKKSEWKERNAREKKEEEGISLLVSAFHARKNDYSNVNRKANRIEKINVSILGKQKKKKRKREKKNCSPH